MQLKSLKVLSSDTRNSSIDVLRGVAIITVVLYHFNTLLPYGQLGVDLFFVISGLLIGGILLKDYDKGINFPRFFLQRGFKIWPSYYFFLIAANIIAYLFFRNFSSDQYIPLWDLKRYLFFYQNYSGLPFHRTFDGVWSLCVEEHFYIMLPIFLIVLKKMNANKRMLLASIFFVIILGILFKVLSLYLTRSKDTFAGTHNRIDALAWGVLLAFIIRHYPDFLKRKALLFLAGLAVIIFTIAFDATTGSVFFQKVMLHTLIPIGCFLVAGGVYFLETTRLKLIRFIAYYSYNLYLWHPVVRPPIEYYMGYTWISFIVYCFFSFCLAMLSTILIEETVLKYRSRTINFIFNKKNQIPALETAQ